MERDESLKENKMESAASSVNIIPFSPTGTTGRTPVPAAATRRTNDFIDNNFKVLSSIWERADEGMRLTDERGLIISVNPAFCALSGKTSEELAGTHFTATFADIENREKMMRSYETRFRSRQAESLYERRFVLWNNRTVDVEISEWYVDAEDGRALMLTRMRDITLEKLTQNALAESELKYRGLFANSILPMFQSSVDGRLLNANRALLKLLGYNNFYELADLDIARDTYANPDERETVSEVLRVKGYIVNAEIRLKRKNGKIITVLENARSMYDEDGNVIGYEGILEDITMRKSLEKKLQEYVWALEKSKTALADLNIQKDKLFSILSHDLRSPFSSILGFCDILLKEHDQLSVEDQQQFVAYIQEAAQDQLSLVNKLLDWSRLESGRIKMDRGEINLQDIVKKSISSLMGLAHQKHVNLHSTLPANVIIHGDRHMLGQVFGNLLGNSMKFTPNNGTVSVELLEEKDTHWVIGVRDTGIGIPDEDVHKLFKVEEKYTRKGLQGEKGTGLGLPVVHEIVQKHHGMIDVQSKSGAGTLFLITFPKSRRESNNNILVVDDEYGMRVLHSRYIKRIWPDACILQASDGKEAYELARESNPRVIVSDNDMPDLDGLELVRNLKHDPTTSNIPIIIITGHDSDSNREALMDQGASIILSKPVTPEQLAEVLKRYELTNKTAAI
jgi:PAS domain S-box-containing protein